METKFYEKIQNMRETTGMASEPAFWPEKKVF